MEAEKKSCAEDGAEWPDAGLAAGNGISAVAVILWSVLLLFLALLPLAISGNLAVSLVILCLPVTAILVYVDVLRPQSLLSRIQSILEDKKTLPETLFELDRLQYPEFFLSRNNIFSVDIEVILASSALLVFGVSLGFLKKAGASGPALLAGAIALASVVATYRMLHRFETRARKQLDALKGKKRMRLFFMVRSTVDRGPLPRLEEKDFPEINELLQQGYPDDVFFHERLKTKALELLGKLKSGEALAVVKEAFFSGPAEIRRAAYDVLQRAAAAPEANSELLRFLIAKKDWDLIRKINRWGLEQLLSAYELGAETDKDWIASLVGIPDENRLIDLATEGTGLLQGPAFAMLLKKWRQPADFQKISERLVRNGREDAAERLLLRAFDRISEKSSLASLIAQFYIEQKKDFLKAAEWLAESAKHDERGDFWSPLLYLGALFDCFPRFKEQADQLKDAASDMRGAAVGLNGEYRQRIHALAAAVDEKKAIEFLDQLWNSSLRAHAKRFRREPASSSGSALRNELACSKCGNAHADMAYPGSHTRCPQCGVVLCKTCYTRLSYTCPKCRAHEEAEWIHE